MRTIIACLVLFEALSAFATPGYKAVGFEDLSSYAFETPEPAFLDDPAIKRKPPKLKSHIPARVRALDGKKVEITGYMLPLDQGEDMSVKRFILMRNQVACCFGHANRINEFIMVRMPGEGVDVARFVPAAPMRVLGTLSVGAEFQDGVLSSLYQMTGESAIQPGIDPGFVSFADIGRRFVAWISNLHKPGRQ